MAQATQSAPDIPEFMTAVQGKDYGPIDEMLSVENNVKVPRLADLPPKKQASHIVIQTYAVALAPGDCRVLSGLTRILQGPPSFPYVPGGDCCGKVVEMPANATNLPFQLGDVVAARFNDKPMGALGLYAMVSSDICDKIPDGMAPTDAAALAGATPATLFADPIQKNERVLILGAGGEIALALIECFQKNFDILLITLLFVHCRRRRKSLVSTCQEYGRCLCRGRLGRP